MDFENMYVNISRQVQNRTKMQLVKKYIKMDFENM